MHSPRPRIRGRDPHPHPHPHPHPGGGGGGGGGGRHRRRSPPAPPSPRYQRRPQRRTPPPPRRGGDPHPDVSAAPHHRILLEAGRLAAHYLVAQGVIPEHVLRAREDPPAPRPAHPPASRGRKLDDGGGGGGGGDARSRRNDGDWARAWEDDDRLARKSTRWDRRSHSFDDRRKHHDAGHDVDRGARRIRDYDEPRRPPMSRSYSHNDRRPSADGGRVDPRSRSRSRSRTRSYYAGSGSGSSRDHGHVDEMPRHRHQRRVPSSVVVADSAHQEMAIQDGEMESEIHAPNRARDISEDEDGEFEQGISEDEDGEFAAARLNSAENGVEMDVTQHQLSDSNNNVHPLESVEELAVHRGSQLSNAVEDREAAMDACTRETLGEDNDCSQARDEVVAPHPQSEGEARAGNFINRDKPDLPASCRVFDLNVVEAPYACEMTEICGDPQADHVSDSVPDLVGRIHQQTICHASEIQGQDERAGDSHMFKNGHDLIRYDPNSEAVEDAHDIHMLENEKLLLSHGIDAHDTTRIQRSNGHLHLNQNADELEHENDWMENHTVIGEHLLLSDGMDGHPVHSYQTASEPKSLPMGVYDLPNYNLRCSKDGEEEVNKQIWLFNQVQVHAAQEKVVSVHDEMKTVDVTEIVDAKGKTIMDSSTNLCSSPEIFISDDQIVNTQGSMIEEEKVQDLAGDEKAEDTKEGAAKPEEQVQEQEKRSQRLLKEITVTTQEKNENMATKRNLEGLFPEIKKEELEAGVDLMIQVAMGILASKKTKHSTGEDGGDQDRSST